MSDLHNTTVATATTKTHEFGIYVFGVNFIAFKRPINRATGKAWQARRTLYCGPDAQEARQQFDAAIARATGGR